MKLRILYILPSLANKGPGLVINELVGSFMAHGHDCEVAFFDNINEIHFNCPTFQINQNRPISFRQYDIVHSNGIRPDRYVFRFRKSNNSHTRFVTTLHNYIFEDLRFQYNFITALGAGCLWLRWTSNHHQVVALSRDAMDYYAKWIDRRKLAFVYNARTASEPPYLSDKEISKINTFRDGQNLIGVNALLTRRKGVDLLIKALPLLPNYKLWINGNGKELNSLIKLAKSLNVEKSCHFAGYQPNATSYLRHFDIFALPSRSEGFPLALLEAATASIPVVASNLPVIREIFSEDHLAIFQLDNVTSLANAIRLATGNIEMAGRLKHYVSEQLNTERQYIEYNSIYHSILGKHQGA